MKTICSILIAVLVSLSSFAQIKKGTALPLSDQQMLDVKTNSKMALKDYKKEKGLLVIFSCNTCPFVVGTPDFPGWERQYNRLFEQATKQNIGFVLVNSNEAKRGKEDSIEEMMKQKKNFK